MDFTEYTKLPWRVGKRVRRTIYVVLPNLLDDNHPLIGMMDTPELALEVVDSHNNSLEKLATRKEGLSTYSYAEKEQIIVDLKETLKHWQTKPNLEESILLATNGGTRSQRVYRIIGISSDILGPQASIPQVVEHAINLIRND